MPINNRSDIEWAPRVSLSKVRQLYLREAQGLCDDDLVEEVGMGLYQRCADILEFTRAVEVGRVRCKRCARQGGETLLQRVSMKPAELLKCPVCGWQVRWRVYLKEAERLPGSLYAGHAREAFIHYTQEYPRCRDAREKIVAIDRLIHEFHWLTMREDKTPESRKPAGVNLLQGSSTQVVEMLDELTYGHDAPPEVLAMRAWWRSQQGSGIRAVSPPEEE